MAWKVELSQEADHQLDKLDPQIARRILKFLHERVGQLENPRSIGEALHGPKFGEFWKYRVGDYRLICSIEDKLVLILVLRMGIAATSTNADGQISIHPHPSRPASSGSAGTRTSRAHRCLGSVSE